MTLRLGTRIRMLDTGEEMVALARPNGSWPAVVVCPPDDPALAERLRWCRGQKWRLHAEDVDRQVGGRAWEIAGAKARGTR